MFNLSTLESLILLSSLIGALFTFWRVVRLVKRASERFIEGIESITKLFQLMQQEYSRNGGATHKDLLYKILEKQETLINNQNELIVVSKELLKCLKENHIETSDT